MTHWQYLTAEVQNGMLILPGNEASEHRQALRGGLDYLGSQGWELAGTLEKLALGHTQSYTLIFKRPSEI